MSGDGGGTAPQQAVPLVVVGPDYSDLPHKRARSESRPVDGAAAAAAPAAELAPPIALASVEDRSGLSSIAVLASAHADGAATDGHEGAPRNEQLQGGDADDTEAPPLPAGEEVVDEGEDGAPPTGNGGAAAYAISVPEVSELQMDQARTILEKSLNEGDGDDQPDVMDTAQNEIEKMLEILREINSSSDLRLEEHDEMMQQIADTVMEILVLMLRDLKKNFGCAYAQTSRAHVRLAATLCEVQKRAERAKDLRRAAEQQNARFVGPSVHAFLTEVANVFEHGGDDSDATIAALQAVQDINEYAQADCEGGDAHVRQHVDAAE